MQEKKIERLAIFASGTGSNAEKIITYFAQNPVIIISLIVCNRPDAGVLEIARKYGIETLLLEKEKFFRGNAYTQELRNKQIDLIVLAGFLWKIPARLIDAFRGNILNIHPSLLPKYGGKGMYGHFVHEAVIEAGEKETGITIHLVDEHYDHGRHLFQAVCPVLQGDTPETLAARVLRLEHENFPRVIAGFIQAKDS